jgi:site-specific DNA-methyltransferase (adenine-specific)
VLELNKIYKVYFLESFKELDDNSIDLIVTDPPFAIDFKAVRCNYHRTPSNVLTGYNEITPDDYYEFTYNWIKEAYRVLKDTGSMYVFSGWNNLKDVLIALDNVGFITLNHIIWKYQFGVVTKNKFITSHYHILFVCKNPKKYKFYSYSRYSKEARDENNRSMHYKDMEDVWEIKREYWNGIKKTPTKLPAELIIKILKYSSKEGDLILDPFMGSGQVAVVSKFLNRNYIGFEIVKDYYDFILERLESNDYKIITSKNKKKRLKKC